MAPDIHSYYACDGRYSVPYVPVKVTTSGTQTNLLVDTGSCVNTTDMYSLNEWGLSNKVIKVKNQYVSGGVEIIDEVVAPIEFIKTNGTHCGRGIRFKVVEDLQGESAIDLPFLYETDGP